MKYEFCPRKGRFIYNLNKHGGVYIKQAVDITLVKRIIVSKEKEKNTFEIKFYDSWNIDHCNFSLKGFDTELEAGEWIQKNVYDYEEDFDKVKIDI